MWRNSKVQRYRNRKNKELGGKPCPICNFHCVSLGSHMFYAHDITAREYRILNDMNISQQLTTNELHDRLSKIASKTYKPSQSIHIRKGRPKGIPQYMSSKEKNRRQECAKINLLPYQYLGAIAIKKRNKHKTGRGL